MKHQKSINNNGFVTIEFLLGLVVIVLPTFFLVVTFPAWYETTIMAKMAAREASRTYALTGSAQQSTAIVQTIATNYNLSPEEISIELSEGPVTPGGEVSATVAVKIPLSRLSFFDRDAGGFEYRTTHVEPVDLYRVIEQ